MIKISEMVKKWTLIKEVYSTLRLMGLGEFVLFVSLFFLFSFCFNLATSIHPSLFQCSATSRQQAGLTLDMLPAYHRALGYFSIIYHYSKYAEHITLSRLCSEF